MKALLAYVLSVGLLLIPGSLPAALTLKTVTVGDSGNEPDGNGLGRVDYVFEITEKQITNDIYARFLNAVDAHGTNVRGLYNERMASSPQGGVVFDPSAKTGQKYSCREGMEESPIYYVNWVDAARFCNWLANGSKIGSSTELGSYNLVKSRGQITPRVRTASFWIPDADEIYKAANYLPKGLWRSVSNLLEVEPTETGEMPSPVIQLRTIGNRIMDIVDVEIPAALQNLVSEASSQTNTPPNTSAPAPVFEAINDPQAESAQRSFYVATIPESRYREEPYADGLPVAGLDFARPGSASGGRPSAEPEGGDGGLFESAQFVSPPPSS